jgi:serine/threonine protein kinase
MNRSTATNNSRTDRTQLGTTGYRAPEVQEEAMHGNSITAKADVYSLGIVIWRMMHTTLGDAKSREIRNESIKQSFQLPEGYTFAMDEIPEYDAMYSSALHQLVTDRLHINPDRRLGYEQLRIKTRAEFLTPQERLGGIQVDAEYGGAVAEHLRVVRKEEVVFKVGSSFQEPVRKRRKVEAPTGLAPTA